MPTTVTSNGEITIPAPIRNHLGLAPGNVVDFELRADGSVLLVKIDPAAQPSRFEALRGSAGPGMSTDEIMALLRGAPSDPA